MLFRSLVSLADARAAFPKIPGVLFPPMMNELELLDFGPAFGPVGGKLGPKPPRLGAKYTMFVPKPNDDGLDVAGVRPLEIRVPVGTHTGWNVRNAASRAPNLCALDGAYIAFPVTRAARERAGDPRRSLEERYANAAGYVKAVQDAAQGLIKERFLIEEDAARAVKAAEAATLFAPSNASR